MHKLPIKMHWRKPVWCFLCRIAGGGLLMTEAKKLWGGRFTGQIDPGFARYNRSFGFDRRLFEADARGSLAHCEGLRAAGVLNDEEAGVIKRGLRDLLERAGREGEAFFEDEAAEDVHSFIEARL